MRRGCLKILSSWLFLLSEALAAFFFLSLSFFSCSKKEFLFFERFIRKGSLTVLGYKLLAITLIITLCCSEIHRGEIWTHPLANYIILASTLCTQDCRNNFVLRVSSNHFFSSLLVLPSSEKPTLRSIGKYAKRLKKRSDEGKGCFNDDKHKRLPSRL